MTDHNQKPNHDTAAQPVQPGMSGTSNEGISPEGNFSTDADATTETPERTDIEGSSISSDQKKQTGGFVGSDSKTDTSSELVEDRDEQDQAPNGQ